MYGFKPMQEFELIPCEIIGKSPGPYNKSIILDRGEKAGIRKNLPVIAAKGLIGKIIETSTLSSEMLTLYNRSTIISALDLRSRVQGIVKWKGSRYLLFDDVSLHSDVVAGDTIITSGMGGIYPQGIFVGIVQSVKESPKEIVMNIAVEPLVDVSVLEDVFVIVQRKLPASVPESDSMYRKPRHFDIFNSSGDAPKAGFSLFDLDSGAAREWYGAGKRGLTIE
jgi:rod shape-determining protein MreC